MLRLENLSVKVGNKVIFENMNFHIPRGETKILFGPNGTGKSSLMMTIMGFSLYKVIKGKIFFKGQDITNMPINERAEMGMGILLQRPPTINGLSFKNLLKLSSKKTDEEIEKSAKGLNFSHLLNRDVNHNLSGGEIKRAEVLQLMLQDPDFVLLDEPESGVDVENIALIGDSINKILQRGLESPKCVKHNKIIEEQKKSALVITHTGHILDYITADQGQVLYNGVLCCSQNAREILKWIRQYGYGECVRCSN